MKITDLKTFVVGNPWKNWVFIKLYTDEGIVGLGEATRGLATKPSIGDLEELRRHVIGEDPLHPERLWYKMHKARYFGQTIGMSAIEQACWDILGKIPGCARLATLRRQASRPAARLRQRLVSGPARPGLLRTRRPPAWSSRATPRSSSTPLAMPTS